MRKKKAIQEQELKEHEQKLSLSLVTRSLSEFGTWRGFDSFELCLVLNEMSKKLGCLEWWWLGVFIALNHHIAVREAICRWAHRIVRCATGHCPVRQPRHPTVRVLTVSTVGALSSWGIGQ
jgi:hypothetical protein